MFGLSHADAFFVISSIGTILFIVLVSVVLFQVIKILYLVRNLLERIEVGSELLAEDLQHIRAIFSHGEVISRVVGLFIPGQSKTPRGRGRKTKGK